MSRNHKVLYVMLFDPELKVLLKEDKSSEPQDLVGEDRINPKLQILVEEMTINSELQVSVEAKRINSKPHIDGFAPPRPNSLTKWYVNGSGYFSDLADTLENVKVEKTLEQKTKEVEDEVVTATPAITLAMI